MKLSVDVNHYITRTVDGTCFLRAAAVRPLSKVVYQ